jgi:tRNA 2-thiocytidine biosynthesis protein TtcA
MNMTAKGELSTMPMLLAYRKYPVSLIRPLGYVEERQIIACAEEKGILKAACACPYGLNSKRRDMRKRIADFTGDSGAVKRRIFKALSAGAQDMLMEKPPIEAAGAMSKEAGLPLGSSPRGPLERG